MNNVLYKFTILPKVVKIDAYGPSLVDPINLFLQLVFYSV
jgi:hypothetical protein